MRNDELTETLPGTEILAVGAGDEYARPTSLEWLLSEADFVSLHAKWTPETEGMMGGPQFARMKPNAFFINTARDALVDEVALLQALKERRIAGAALDVLGNEPEIVGNPLLGLPNVIATPHIGGITPETMKTQAARTVAIVQDILAGKVPEGTVNVGEVTHPRLEGLTDRSVESSGPWRNPDARAPH
jgi:phosphoglycerate dehydrogenase-like enzyme